jgi:septal ring factor EnvC (AmiA/AmiB activator)
MNSGIAASNNSSREYLIETVKTWITIDNQIKQLNQKLKQLREEKNSANGEMIRIMRDNNIDVFDIKDGQIQYKQETKKKPLNQKVLLEILMRHPQMGEDQATALNEFVYENREEVIKESIVRKMKK